MVYFCFYYIKGCKIRSLNSFISEGRHFTKKERVDTMLANNVVIRVCSFIPEDWIYFQSYFDTYNNPLYDVYYEGDNRGFDPNTANTQDFRTAQEIHIDFVNKTQPVMYRQTGITTRKTVYTDGSGRPDEFETGQADPSGLTISTSSWSGDTVTFTIYCSESNPLEPGAPPIQYNYTFTVSRNMGEVHVVGNYTEFPNYEIYKKVDSNNWETVLQFDHNVAGTNVYDLMKGKVMNCDVDVM
jgi:hypothetical protein